MNPNQDLILMVELGIIISPGQFIQKVRKRMKVSQQEFAQTLNVSQSYWSKIETNRLEMRLRDWFFFCQIAEVPVVIYGHFLKEQNSRFSY